MVCGIAFGQHVAKQKGKEKAKLLEEKSKNEPVSDEGATTEASGTAAHNPDKPEGL